MHLPSQGQRGISSALCWEPLCQWTFSKSTEWSFWKPGEFRVHSPLPFCWLSPSADTLRSYSCFACVLPCVFSRKLQLFGSRFCHRILRKCVHLLPTSSDAGLDLWCSCTKQCVQLKHAEYCGFNLCIILGWVQKGKFTIAALILSRSVLVNSKLVYAESDVDHNEVFLCLVLMIANLMPWLNLIRTFRPELFSSIWNNSSLWFDCFEVSSSLAKFLSLASVGVYKSMLLKSNWESVKDKFFLGSKIQFYEFSNIACWVLLKFWLS